MSYHYFLPDFVNMQRQSFLNFIEQGIIEEISKKNPITNLEKKVEIFFYPEYYRLTKPSYSIQQAVIYQKSYISKLYVPVQYTDKKKKILLLKWMLLAQLPLMTKRGNFVLNGSARVIVNQLVRSPGIYFRESLYEIYSNKWSPKPNAVAKRFYADIICLKGTWLRIEIDKDFCTWVRLKKGPKIPLLWFLIGMGLNEKRILQSVISPNFLLKSFQKKFYNKSSSSQVKFEKKLKSLLGGNSLENKSEKKFFSLLVEEASEGASGQSPTEKQSPGFATEKRSPEAQKPHREATSKAKQNFLNVFKKTCLSAGKESSLSTPEAWYNIAKLLNLKKMRSFSSSAKKNLKNQNLKTLKPKNKKKKEMLELGRKWFFKKFMNPRTYDLSKQGRFAINQKLSLNLSLFQTTLTEKDLLAATDYLMKVEKGIYKIDDIDHLKNRRVRSSGDLIQVQFGIGLIRLEKAIRLKLNQDKKDAKSFYLNKASSILKEKFITSNTQAKTNKLKSFLKRGVNSVNRSEKGISRVLTDIPISGFVDKKNFYLKRKFLNSMIQPKFINGALKEFFGTHPLSQFMDQINPLSELTHKRRLSSLGPGGVSRDTATLAVRGIHSSHYGRICPIETPEGKNTGLVNSLTTYARVNKNGLIETPFYKIYKGQIQKNVGRVYLSADKEESFKIATPDLKISKLNFLPKQKIPVRIGKDFIPTYRRYVSFIGISPVQMISIATALIPFLEHDDANRALMGSNMQRQAVPLVRSQRPFVGTGLEARAVADSGHAMLTAKSGYILYVSGSKIFLYCDNKKKFKSF